MALSQATTLRPRPGRYDDFIKVSSQVRKICQRLGAQVSVWQVQVGSNAGTVTVAIQHADGAAYGQFIDKLNTDGEWQQLIASFQKDPPAEFVQSNLLRELP